MNHFSDSLILIGMPGAGKSTLGMHLAKLLTKEFVDTDLLIQQKYNKTLQNIVDTQGYLALRNIEEQMLLNTHYSNHVIATGGSVVYSAKAMHHIHNYGKIIFLDVALEELSTRINNIHTRGLVRKPNQSLSELYGERHALYQHYADIKINCNGKSQEDILEEIISEISYTRKNT